MTATDKNRVGDPFFEYLVNGKGAYRLRALTVKSYRRVDKTLKDEDVNTELATYGDALLKLAHCELLLDRVKKLSQKKQKYESDRVLIRVVAKHYDLLSYIRYDMSDKRIPVDYNLVREEDEDNYKYIATTVEALLGAFYMEYRDYDAVLCVVGEWMRLIDVAARRGEA